MNVLTYHNDNFRTGQNLSETLLTPASVNAAGFGKVFAIVMDGKVDAQPLYVSGVNIPGQGPHNVVYAATEHDSVYAFEATRGKVFWQISLLPPGETTSDPRNCGQVVPEIGVTATPVIDPTAGPNGTIYLVAMSKDASGNYYQRLHALDLSTGAEQAGSPVTVQATYPGTGANSSNGQVVFDAKQYKDRAGLLLLNGIVYTSWGSHCDIQPYTGWIIGYDHLSLHQTSVFNFVPNGSDGALWNSGGGPAADSQGNIFAAVANGTFDTALNAQGFPNQGDYGNSFVKLSTTNAQLSPVDFWTMSNAVSESGSDTDLGSGGVMLLPDQIDSSGNIRHLAVGAGKDSNLYVVDRDNLGKFNSSSDSTIYQQLTSALPGGIFSNPAYFNNTVYFGPVGSPLFAFSVTNALLAAASSTGNSFGYPGASPSISANGSANAILWAVENSNPAVLHAYNAANLAQEFYNSNQAPSAQDQFGPGNKYITPTIAGSEVFIGTSNGVAVFSLRPQRPLASGQYAIINQFNRLVLDDPPSATTLNQVVQNPDQGSANQRWILTAQGNFYTIRNAATGLVLADSAVSPSPDAQLWSLRILGAGYVISNKASGLVLDDTGFASTPGVALQLWTPTGNSNQSWWLQ